MGRAIIGFFLILIAVGVVVGIGNEIYQAGVAAGIVEAGRFPAAANVPVTGYGGWHGGGFNILGLIFPLFFLLILFGLIRAAFWGGRGWGHHGRGYGYGYGRWGSDWDKGGPGASTDGPTSWREAREQRMEELHRQFHQREAGSGSASSATGTSMDEPGGSGGSGGSGPRPSA